MAALGTLNTSCKLRRCQIMQYGRLDEPSLPIYNMKAAFQMSLTPSGRYSYTTAAAMDDVVMSGSFKLGLFIGGKYVPPATPAGGGGISELAGNFFISLDFKSSYAWWELPPTVIIVPEPTLPPPNQPDEPPDPADIPPPPPDPIFPEEAEEVYGEGISISLTEHAHDAPDWTTIGGTQGT
jgi:hypothetical protein